MKLRNERGSALVPTLILVSAVATLGLAMLSTGMDGSRRVTFESDDFLLTSAVESVGSLVVAELWDDYVEAAGGAPDTIASLRTWLDGAGIPDSGPGGAPTATDGTDWTAETNLPLTGQGVAKFDHVNVDAVRLVRRDEGDTTELYVTVSASTTRGEGHANPVLNRAVQAVYTVSPDDFAGFDFALLGNNVNCILCHAQIDSVERYYNGNQLAYGSFDRVKVGTLETLAIRHNSDGMVNFLNDADADSSIAGSLYVRGKVTDHHGNEIVDWNELSFDSHKFGASGKLEQDAFGNLTPEKFSPAAHPLQPLENLYIDYPTDYAAMADGALPQEFPPPIPDDGGKSGSGAGNRVVDDAEFAVIASGASGSISGGTISVHPAGSDPIDSNQEYMQALLVGNAPTLGASTAGNVVLYGTPEDPILLDGQVAVDGDVIITGWVMGKGSIVARGNVYVPSDLQYLDGADDDGFRTFGVGANGKQNALGIAAGGNIVIGDYARPSSTQPDKTYKLPGKYEIITGDASGKWSFTLAEMSLFNRDEWARTQPLLPAPGEADNDPSTWSVENPSYDPEHVARYYHFGEGDQIPIYNKGDIGFDAASGTWVGLAEVPLEWDPTLLTIVDPADTSSPYLFDASGNSIAALLEIAPADGWIADLTFKAGIEYFGDNRTKGMPLHIDGLLYTNNAIMTIVNRFSQYEGQLILNGALVSADLGVLVPSIPSHKSSYQGADMPNSPFRVGLQLNYDRRVKDLINVQNPNQIKLERKLWNPTANLL